MSDDRLLGVIADHLRANAQPRGDEAFAHVSDTYGCDAATYARRRGAAPRMPDPTMLMKWELGHAVEAIVCDALQADYEARGYSVGRNARIAWNPHDGRDTCRFITENDAPKPGEILGHMDFYAHNPDGDSVLLEIKSTSFLKGRPPSEPSDHYKEQAATYGIALGAEKAGIIIVCRESGRVAGPFWLDLDKLEFITVMRAKAMLEATDPEAFAPPEPRPRYAWQPRYCSLEVCACAAAAKAPKLEAV